MKTALVTGGAKGIGAQIVRKLCADGYKVAFCYQNSEKKALLLSAELNSCGYDVMALRCDISKSSDVSSMFSQLSEKLSSPLVLVNNAGLAQQKLFDTISDDDWNSIIGSNLSGSFFCCREAVPEMIRQGFGRIINISSVWGQSGASCEVHYSAAKAGVIGLTKALAKELAPCGITVNCLAPGVIATDMLADFSKDDICRLEDEIPAGRLGRAEEVADAVSFLASNSASYVNGQVLGVNGGFI